MPEGGATREDWQQTAARELQEETGYTAGEIEPLLTNFTFPIRLLMNAVHCLLRQLKAGEQELKKQKIFRLNCILSMICLR